MFLFFKTTGAVLCYLIYFQSLCNGASVNVLSKKIKTDIFNKSAFAKRKLSYYLVPKRAMYTSNLELIKH